ncbi:helix-turn-helix domain-containing protein [Sporosarcina sp. SAFN-010]|uniref:helix-turn-helix domain-containing protein n=1 Tax=Sporosarcina sp. SAFN-010 TaxID=3387273 RepID=UPI003F7DD918
MDAKQFKEIRQSKYMTQAEFGALLGLAQSTVQHIEAGRNVISDRTRARLAQVVDIEELISFSRQIEELGSIFPIKS